MRARRGMPVPEDIRMVEGGPDPLVTPVYRTAGGTVVDAWSGQTLSERASSSTEGLLRLAEEAGRPVDVEVERGRWVRVWPDGCQLTVREPASMARRRALDEGRRRQVRRDRRRARLRAAARKVLALVWRAVSWPLRAVARCGQALWRALPRRRRRGGRGVMGPRARLTTRRARRGRGASAGLAQVRQTGRPRARYRQRAVTARQRRPRAASLRGLR